nr:hypothetical protein [Tanacetum cinerariifolium]
MGKCIRLFIKGKKHGRMMLDSIDNGPLVYPTIEEKEQTRLIKYSELTEAQQLQDDCDVQATNIILRGTDLSYQERECKLYNLFDKFAYVKGETLYEYYWRFSQLINDMHTIGMTMQQVQVNTKFLNTLSLEWSKFVTDVKLAKMTQQSQAKFPQLDSNLVVPMFQQGEDLIQCINKAMVFLSAVASRVTVQQLQGRQTQSYVGTKNRESATITKGNFTVGKPRVMKCYNCQGERLMARQCTQPKRPRNAAWFKEKLLLAEAQETAFQTEGLDAYDSDCDDLSSAKSVLMANLSSYDLEVLSESQSKMLDKRNNPISIEKIKISPIDYSKLNKIKEDFGKRFVTQKELSREQAFWLKYFSFSEAPITSQTSIRIEAPSELPIRTTYDAIAVDEITEVQTIFNQMEAAVDQSSIDKNAFEIQIKQLSINNDHLLKQITSQEIVHIAVNSVEREKVMCE